MSGRRTGAGLKPGHWEEQGGRKAAKAAKAATKAEKKMAAKAAQASAKAKTVNGA